MAKGLIEFHALKFLFRSSGVAMVVQILLDDSGGGDPLPISGKFDLEVAKVVNDIQPGSMAPAKHTSEFTNFTKPNAEALFKKTRQLAIKMIIGQIAEKVTTMGYEDGLTGVQSKTKFEVSAWGRRGRNVSVGWRFRRN